MSWDAELEDGAHTIGRWLVDRAAAVAAAHRDRRPRRHDRLRHARRVARPELAEGLRAGGLRTRATGSRRSRATPATTSSRSSPARSPASRSCRCRGGCTPRELGRRARALGSRARARRGRVRGRSRARRCAGSTTCRRSPRSARPGSRRPCRRSRAPRAARHVHDDDPLLVIFTSGSEAAPKGVVLTHANCFWNNLALAQALPLTQDDVVLAMLPQFHVAGWNCQPLLAWWVGATVVLERSFQPARALQLIARAAGDGDDGRADAVRDARGRPRLGGDRHVVAAPRARRRSDVPVELQRTWTDARDAAHPGLRTHRGRAERAAPAGRRGAAPPGRGRAARIRTSSVRIVDPDTRPAARR